MSSHPDTETKWFGVRCVLHHRDLPGYEERVTIWLASTFDEAIARAAAEAQEHVRFLGPSSSLAGIAQAFEMFDRPHDGAEVFSLMRLSDEGADVYIERYFATGQEIQKGK